MPPLVIDYRPLPVFAEFHNSDERERAVIGGYGSGKSHAACGEVIRLGLAQPGSEILVSRKTVPALRDTTESIFVSLLPPEFFAACDTKRMGGHLESVTFPNGTKYYFRGMDDWRKLRSMNLAFILYDEADEIDEESYIGMLSRLRQTKPTAVARAQGAGPITRRGVLLACNPQGKNWIWKRFVSSEKAPRTAYWKSTSLDNPFLPLEYIDSLLAMPDPWVRRFVLCDFDEFGGAIYPDWRYETHVIPPILGPNGYAYDRDSFFLMGFDPGTSSGNAAVWCYYDRANHRLVAVAEYNESGLAANVHADAWRKIEARHGMRVRTRVADPKAVTVRDRGSNMGLDDQYRRLGFNFQLGANKVDTRLHALGQLIATQRFVCTTECTQFFEQVQQYRWEDLTPDQREKGKEAAPLKKNVDLVDAAQYVAARYIPPPRVNAPDRGESETFADEVRAAIRRQLAEGRTATNPHDLGSVLL